MLIVVAVCNYLFLSSLPWAALALGQRQLAINDRDIEGFQHSAGPFHFELIHARRLAQPEVQAQIILRAEACAAKEVCALSKLARRHIDDCAHGIPWALLRHVPYQVKLKPVARAFGRVSEQGGFCVQIIEDGVRATVAIQVADGEPTAGPGVGQCAPRRSTDALESSICEIAKEQRLLSKAGAPLVIINRRIDVPVGDKHILPPVVIVINKARPPAQKRNRHLSMARLKSNVSEIPFTVVAPERV